VVAVTSEDVAEYLPRIQSIAKRFNGSGGAEFDDLVQEAWRDVFLNLRDGKHVSNTSIKNSMRDWVRYCFRRGYSNRVSYDESLKAAE
jgi:DNA-directed RNA polymerase specialized sigma24 family protein